MPAVSEVTIRLESGTVVTMHFEHGTQVFEGSTVEGTCRATFDRNPSHQDVRDTDYLIRKALASVGWKDIHLVPNTETKLDKDIQIRRN